jgi:hypothetical protein
MPIGAQADETLDRLSGDGKGASNVEFLEKS